MTTFSTTIAAAASSLGMATFAPTRANEDLLKRETQNCTCTGNTPVKRSARGLV
ncbi:hypothetical protein GGE07_006462 [Sinorhizobium terangae]|nr:hypothetical protein [Sinorhizobium terangae]